MRPSGLTAALLPVCLCAEPRKELTAEERRAENERLRKLNAQLAEQLEGTAKPIHLGWTSLAAVTGTSVNGSRPSEFYGVRNSFDDGQNVLQNGIHHKDTEDRNGSN